MDCVGFETVASLHTFTKLFIGISNLKIMISKPIFGLLFVLDNIVILVTTTHSYNISSNHV